MPYTFTPPTPTEALAWEDAMADEHEDPAYYDEHSAYVPWPWACYPSQAR